MITNHKNVTITGNEGLDIRSKLVLMTLILVISFLFNHPVIHLIIFILIVIVGRLKKFSTVHLLSSIQPLIPIILMIVLCSGFRSPDVFLTRENKIIVWHFGNTLTLTTGGLLLGCTFMTRLINMVTMTTLLLKTTALDDFIQLFHKLKFPHTVAFILTTAIRFIPELQKKKKQIIESQTARGADFESGGFIKRYYIQISIMLPLIINAIIMADKLTIALLNRGFGYQNSWTNLEEINLKPKDITIILICITICIFSVLARLKTEYGIL